MYNCKYCGKEFSNSQSCNGHQGACKQNPDNSVQLCCKFCSTLVLGKRVLNQHERHCDLNPDKISYNISDPTFEKINANCTFCGKRCETILSLRRHERHCSNNPNREISNIEKHRSSGNYVQWNAGLTKYTDSRVAQGSESLLKYYESHEGTFLGKHHTEATKKLLSDQQIETFHSDDNRHSRAAHGWYDGTYFMSGWEFAYYVYTKDSGHSIRRCRDRYEYEYKGKRHYYYPDFIVDDCYIIEIKGLESDVDKVKYNAVKDLKVLKEIDLLVAIKYTQDKFKTRDFQSLLLKKKE